MNTHRPLVPSDLPQNRADLVRQRARDFAALAKHIALHGDAAHIAEQEALPARVQTLAKAAVLAGALADEGGLSSLGAVAAGWLETLRTASAFDAMLPAMRPAIIHQPFSISTVSLVSSEIAEGLAKPVSALTLTSIDALAPRKTAVIVVMTRELLRFSGAGALLDTEMRNAIAAGTDSIFLSYIIAQTTPIASAGNTTANVITDIDALLTAVTLGIGSRPYFVFSPAAAKKLIMKETAAAFAFPNATPLGGNIAGVPLIVSDQLPTGTALLLDASAVAAVGGEMQLRSSTSADVQMADDATVAVLGGSPSAPTPAAMTSLFQTNSAAVRGERTFAFRLLRTDAAASLSGVSY